MEPRFDFFFVYTQYARLCGNIAKQLYSASALSHPISEILTTAAELEASIDMWRESIPHDIRPGRFFRPSDIPKYIPQIQALSLNFGYHYVICAVHRRFSAMFQCPETGGRPSSALISADTKFLEAARSMILLTKHLDIESHTPGWYVYFPPLKMSYYIYVRKLMRCQAAVLLPCYCTHRSLHLCRLQP